MGSVTDNSSEVTLPIMHQHPFVHEVGINPKQMNSHPNQSQSGDAGASL